ncbi:glycosyltransferase family 87 protein [Bradyrhizobium oligotrophicum]|uniref:glycosyltransferase family 87 protein n=1 Tax=Bradyrhizobium oligotrophicum TaxID=44255 RepID=UPI003EBD4101
MPRSPSLRCPRSLEHIRQWLARRIPTVTNDADREMLQGLLLMGALLFILTLLTYVWTTQWSGPFPRDATTLVVGRDFLNFWMYGRAAFTPDPSRFYDIAVYNDALSALLGSDYPGQNVPNPPNALAVMAPFGLLPYLPALACWFAIGLLAFHLGCRRAFADSRVLLIVAISPAGLMCLLSGQSSFLTTAALFGALAWPSRRPALAGILIGLLTIKPQLGVLLPVMLVAASQWRVIAWATLTTLVLIAVSVAIGGLQSWHDYVAKGLPTMNEVLRDPSGIAVPFHASIFMNLRGLLGDAIAEALQTIAALLAAAGVFAVFRYRRDADPAVLRVFFLACTVSASPYFGIYDVLPLTCAAVALVASGALDGTGRRLAQLTFWLPALQLLFGYVQMPGPGLIAPAFAIFIGWRLFAPTRQTAVARMSETTSGHSRAVRVPAEGAVLVGAADGPS